MTPGHLFPLLEQVLLFDSLSFSFSILENPSLVLLTATFLYISCMCDKQEDVRTVADIQIPKITSNNGKQI